MRTLFLYTRSPNIIFLTTILEHLVIYNSSVTSSYIEVICGITWKLRLLCVWRKGLYKSKKINTEEIYVIILVLLVMLSDIRWYIKNINHAMLTVSVKHNNFVLLFLNCDDPPPGLPVLMISYLTSPILKLSLHHRASLAPFIIFSTPYQGKSLPNVSPLLVHPT